MTAGDVMPRSSYRKLSFSKIKQTTTVWCQTIHNARAVSCQYQLSLKQPAKRLGMFAFEIMYDGHIYISTFLIAEDEREKGYGSFLIKYAGQKLSTIIREIRITPTVVSGYQLDDSAQYWSRSLRMFGRFAEALFGTKTNTRTREISFPTGSGRYFEITPLC